MKNKDAIVLFLKREGKELLGKHQANFWVMMAIFLLAILSIGFGSASLRYLKYKMDDPFVQWVDITAQQGATKAGATPIEDYLKKADVQAHYNFVDPQPNFVQSMYFRHIATGKDVQLEGRSIKSSSSVLAGILDKNNVVEMRQGIPFSDDELGLILTAEALERMGYESGDVPRFVNLSVPFDEEACEMVGLGKGNKGYYEVSFPVVAVVMQLPGMYSYMFTDRFWNDLHANSQTTWDVTDEDNNQELILCGDLDDLQKVEKQLDGWGLSISYDSYNGCWDYCDAMHVVARDADEELVSYYNNVFQSLDLKKLDVVRLYPFVPIMNYYEVSVPSYYSIQMPKLDSIRAFQDALYENCGIKLDMTSIEAKENFRFVQRMGNILSYCIILISVIFICVFIYFLLNTHFQKIQRNLGTFKAFGVSNKTLDMIYMTLLLMMTITSFVMSIVLSWVVSLVTGLINKIEGLYSWLDVWVWQNLLLLVMAIVASVVVTKVVANKKLKHTPGDLIYDRTEEEEYDSKNK